MFMHPMAILVLQDNTLKHCLIFGQQNKPVAMSILAVYNRFIR